MGATMSTLHQRLRDLEESGALPVGSRAYRIAENAVARLEQCFRMCALETCKASFFNLPSSAGGRKRRCCCPEHEKVLHNREAVKCNGTGAISVCARP